METLIIRAKSKSNAKLLATLARKLGEQTFDNIEALEEAADALLLNKMKKNRKEPILSPKEQADFLAELEHLALL